MKKAELVFGKYSQNPPFLKDLKSMLSLSKESMENILDVYLSSEYRMYYHRHVDKFSEKTGLETTFAHTLTHLLDLFAYLIVPKDDVDNIIEALKEIEIFDNHNLEIAEPFLSKLKDDETQKILDTLDLIDDEIGGINPRFSNITYNIQNRVVIKNDKIIKRFPVATIHLDTMEDDSLILEVLEDDIDSIMETLEQIKKHLLLSEE